MMKKKKIFNKYLYIILILILNLLLQKNINLYAAETLDSKNFFESLENITLSSKIIQIFLLITVLSLAPSILIMITSFIRISLVLSIMRTALGLQQSPPNQILISLSLFLTIFIMYNSFEQAYHKAILPLIEGNISEKEALPLIIEPFKNFMIKNTRKKDIELFQSIATHNKNEVNTDNVDLYILIPSFMISELRRGFEIGFLIFLPFIIIDIVVASILMAMGMMMMPPIMISLPFKIIFFVLIDGWYLISGSLVQSFIH
ncbi:MAG: flagellar type III secretion system pore protein FliP [Rickettsia sp.]|nr:flagellar type III secretion system pore protein FliP [Rickettsia sp.]